MRAPEALKDHEWLTLAHLVRSLPLLHTCVTLHLEKRWIPRVRPDRRELLEHPHPDTTALITIRREIVAPTVLAAIPVAVATLAVVLPGAALSAASTFAWVSPRGARARRAVIARRLREASPWGSPGVVGAPGLPAARAAPR